MRILLLDMGQELRGGQRQVLYLAEQLAATTEFDPMVAGPAGSPLLTEAKKLGVKRLPMPGRLDWDPRNLIVLKTLIKRHSPDVVHTQCARSASLGAMLLRVPPRLQYKLIHSRRVSYPLNSGWSARKYQIADKVVAVSAEIKSVLTAPGPNALDPDRVAVVHSGIDPATYRKRSPEAANDPLVMGTIGALTAQKGYDVLLDALAILATRNDLPGWQMRIIGDGPLRGELEEKTARLGLINHVAFMGYVESREVLPLLDAVLVPSVDGEGSSGSIKEAWGTSIPVICSDLPSNLELVQPEASGLAFANRSAQDLADTIATLLNNPDLRTSLGVAGHARLQEFTHIRMAEQYMELYRNV